MDANETEKTQKKPKVPILNITKVLKDANEPSNVIAQSPFNSLGANIMPSGTSG